MAFISQKLRTVAVEIFRTDSKFKSKLNNRLKEGRFQLVFLKVGLEYVHTNDGFVEGHGKCCNWLRKYMRVKFEGKSPTK